MSTKDEGLDKFAQQLQKQIMEHIKKRYTQTVIDHWQNPKNFQKLENPDGYAQVKGSCGDTMEMFIKMKKDTILQCSFQTDGCGTTIACGSIATELAQNKTLTQALAQVSTESILKKLDGLPQEDVHCAQLASETLRRALADYLSQRKTRWKKYYRKI